MESSDFSDLRRFWYKDGGMSGIVLKALKISVPSYQMPVTGNLQLVTIFAPREKSHLITHPVCSPKVPATVQWDRAKSRWHFLFGQRDGMSYLWQPLPKVFAIWKNKSKTKCPVSFLFISGKTSTYLALLNWKDKLLFCSTKRPAHCSRSMLYEALWKTT